MAWMVLATCHGVEVDLPLPVQTRLRHVASCSDHQSSLSVSQNRTPNNSRSSDLSSTGSHIQVSPALDEFKQTLGAGTSHGQSSFIPSHLMRRTVFPSFTIRTFSIADIHHDRKCQPLIVSGSTLTSRYSATRSHHHSLSMFSSEDCVSFGRRSSFKSPT